MSVMEFSCISECNEHHWLSLRLWRDPHGGGFCAPEERCQPFPIPSGTLLSQYLPTTNNQSANLPSFLPVHRFQLLRISHLLFSRRFPRFTIPLPELAPFRQFLNHYLWRASTRYVRFSLSLVRLTSVVGGIHI